MIEQPDGRDFDDPGDAAATPEQLAELSRLGVREADLQGLTSADADEWIDRLQAQRREAGRSAAAARRRPG